MIEKRGNAILVETAASAGCGECAVGHTCAIGGSSAKRRLWIDCDRDVRTGDEVTFYIAGSAVVLGAVVLYLTPVVMLLAGIIIGSSAAAAIGLERDLSSIAGGAAGLAASVLIVHAASRAMKRTRVAVPRLIDITRKTAGN